MFADQSLATNDGCQLQASQIEVILSVKVSTNELREVNYTETERTGVNEYECLTEFIEQIIKFGDESLSRYESNQFKQTNWKHAGSTYTDARGRQLLRFDLPSHQ